MRKIKIDTDSLFPLAKTSIMPHGRDMSNTKNPMTLEALQARIVRDMVCAGCKGTGKRGRGKCHPCQGSGETDNLSSPRVKFNHGFHDATLEALEFNSTRNTEGMAFWYRLGYEMGLQHAAYIRTRPKTSSEAWHALTGMNDDLVIERHPDVGPDVGTRGCTMGRSCAYHTVR